VEGAAIILFATKPTQPLTRYPPCPLSSLFSKSGTVDGVHTVRLYFPEGAETPVTAAVSDPALHLAHLPVSHNQGYLPPWKQSLQDRQPTRKAIMRRVRATILPWRSRKYYIF
jgi:hypothetical protein